MKHGTNLWYNYKQLLFDFHSLLGVIMALNLDLYLIVVEFAMETVPNALR